MMPRATTSPRPARRTAQRPGNRAKFAYPGASTNPLSKLQKGIICQVARQAFDHRAESGRFEDWRRDQQVLAVGIASLTECTQQNYLMLVAHFEGLAGEGGKQFKASHRSLDEEKRQARHLLEVALDDRRLDLGYAVHLCRAQYKCALDDASPKQLWQIKFTVEARHKPVTEDTTANPF